MVTIRKLSLFDRHKVKKMISFLDSDSIDLFTKAFMNNLFLPLHYFLPLKLKFLPESYVLEEDREILGMITIQATSGNPYKVKITRLLFVQNYYNVGKQLIEYIIARYGARGAKSFDATIESCHDELLRLFTDGCGFRQCSCKELWRMNTSNSKQNLFENFRPFKNSDAKDVASLYNDSIISYFRPFLARVPDEYKESLFQGLNNDYHLRYVLENSQSKKIDAYFSITTTDNINYILDITTTGWLQINLDDIFAFTIKQISKRKKDFSLFVKTKKYTENVEQFENYLNSNNFNCIQSKQIIVKDFYRIIKETSPIEKMIFFNEPTNTVAYKTSTKNCIDF